jgi:hypothetical protein
MRTGKWNAFLSGFCAVAVVLGVAGSALADVTVEKGSSIIVFPKVRAGNGFDTVIQLNNTGNSMVHAKCYYVNALGPDDRVDGNTWVEIDFDIWLTKQQPTHWLVSEGRNVRPDCGFGEDCSGFPPGLVPPMPNFEGELKCIEVTESGEPITGNHLEGVATIKVTRTSVEFQQTSGDFGVYNAIGIRGNPDAVPTNPLQLDGATYDACPERLILNHFSTGSEDPANLGGTNETELTMVPCSQDFELQEPGEVKLQFRVFNEFEQVFSASVTVRCYFNEEITSIDSLTDPNASIFSFDVLGTTVGSAIITPVVQQDGTSGAVIAVVERILSDGSSRFARSLNNVHGEGNFLFPAGNDEIRLTEMFN